MMAFPEGKVPGAVPSLAGKAYRACVHITPILGAVK